MSIPLHRVIQDHSSDQDERRWTKPRTEDDQRARARCLACVFHVDRGLSLESLAAHYGVAVKTIRRWIAIGRGLNDPILDVLQEVFSLLVDPDDHA